MSLAEVFFAGLLNNDARVLTALNNTKTHLSKHLFYFDSFCCSFAVFVFFMFVTERRRGVQRETAAILCRRKTSNSLSFATTCHLPISATRIFSVPGPPSQFSVLLKQPWLQIILVTQTPFYPILSPATFLTGNIPVILEQIDQPSKAWLEIKKLGQNNYLMKEKQGE